MSITTAHPHTITLQSISAISTMSAAQVVNQVKLNQIIMTKHCLDRTHINLILSGFFTKNAKNSNEQRIIISDGCDNTFELDVV